MTITESAASALLALAAPVGGLLPDETTALLRLHSLPPVEAAEAARVLRERVASRVELVAAGRAGGAPF